MIFENLKTFFRFFGGQNMALDLEDLRCELGKLELEHPLVLGAGAAKHILTDEGLEGWSKKTEASLLIGGTITYYPRTGNSGQVFYHEPNDCSKVINWMGMPNQGIAELDYLPQVVLAAHKRDQLIGVSVAGTVENHGDMSIEEQFVYLVDKAFAKGADMVELNFGCPNTEKKPISYDTRSMERILTHISEFCADPSRRVCVKVSPYESMAELREAAAVLNYYDIVEGVSAINTLPNQQWILPDGTLTITQNNGIGGLSGEVIFSQAITNVEHWRKNLSPQKYVIGGGGVVHSHQVMEMRKAGADAVFMVSAPLVFGARHFGKVINDLLDF